MQHSDVFRIFTFPFDVDTFFLEKQYFNRETDRIKVLLYPIVQLKILNVIKQIISKSKLHFRPKSSIYSKICLMLMSVGFDFSRTFQITFYRILQILSGLQRVNHYTVQNCLILFCQFCKPTNLNMDKAIFIFNLISLYTPNSSFVYAASFYSLRLASQ